MGELEEKAILLMTEIEEDEQALTDFKNKLRHKKNDLKALKNAINVLADDDEKDIGLILPIVVG